MKEHTGVFQELHNFQRATWNSGETEEVASWRVGVRAGYTEGAGDQIV